MKDTAIAYTKNFISVFEGTLIGSNCSFSHLHLIPSDFLFFLLSSSYKMEGATINNITCESEDSILQVNMESEMIASGIEYYDSTCGFADGEESSIDIKNSTLRDIDTNKEIVRSELSIVKLDGLKISNVSTTADSMLYFSDAYEFSMVGSTFTTLPKDVLILSQSEGIIDTTHFIGSAPTKETRAIYILKS